MNRTRLLTILLLLLALSVSAAAVQAQTDEATPEPVSGSEDTAPLIPQLHTVQSGENLTVIAEIYGVTVEELLAVNNLDETALLYVGQQLIIPGGEGEAIATMYEAQIGDTLKGIADAFNTSKTSLIESNQLINPYMALSAGQDVMVVSRTGSAAPQQVSGMPYIVGRGDTLLSIAAAHNLSPWALAAANNLEYPTFLFPGQRLRLPQTGVYRDLPGEWIDVSVHPWPVRQGGTLSIYVENLLAGQPQGSLAGHPLRFVPYENGFVALAGLDAFTELGLVTLELAGSGDQPWQPFSQEMQVVSGNYGMQYITIPDELSALLEPEIRQQEDIFLDSIYTRFSEVQQWEGLFQMPVTNTIVTAPYGDSRSYNGGPVEIFHTGVDFAGTVGTPILTPAGGTVVYTGDLELRGQTIVIDHGLGVMSAYFHLSEIVVNLGDVVAAGQMIAAGGNTGLSSGPHLHWDLRVDGIAVDGVQWTEEQFP